MLAAGAGAGVLATALLATPAGAATFTVTNLNDAGTGSLRQAIDDANLSPGADTIDFAPEVTGTITLASDLSGISEGLTISGPGAAALTISGAGFFHAFDVDTQGTGAVSISGLTVSESVGVVRLDGATLGGALRVLDTTITLDDVEIRDSSAESQSSNALGGGVFVENGTGLGDVTISNSVVAGNTAVNTDQNSSGVGGGVFIAADDVTLESTELSQNSASIGGGAFISARGSLAIDDLLITNNLARDVVGGMIASGRTVVMTDSVVTGNVAADVIGGVYIVAGLYYGFNEAAALTVSNTRISSNRAAELGGGLIGLFSSEDAPAHLDRITVTENIGDEVGGLAILGNMGITSSTVSGNTGAGINVGYGIAPTSVAVCSLQTLTSLKREFLPLANSLQPSHEGDEPAAITIINSTVSNNSREGIKIDEGTLNVKGDTVSPSACGSSTHPVNLGLTHVLAADNGLDDIAGSAISLFSLIENPSSKVTAGYGTITGVDPGLLPLESVNNTVSVVPITFGSAAWNAGWPGFTPPPATDQRGLPRVVDIIDIGAYEVQEAVLVPKFTG